MERKLTITGDAKVTITRLWHRPEIHIRVSSEGIQLELPMTDFLTALSQELGWTALVTQGQLRKAADKVMEGVKAESAKIV